MLERPQRFVASACTLLLVGLTACGDAADEPYVEEELPPPAADEDPAEAAPELGPEEIEPVMVDMEALTDDPSVSGEATILREGGITMVAIDVTGLPEAGEYEAHIHTGTCEDGGPVEIDLEPVMALDDGAGSSLTTLEDEDLPEDEDWFIQVHGQDGTPISCGETDEDLDN